MNPQPRNWFRSWSPADSAASSRLVCLPHAGGTPDYFRSWGGSAPSGVELLAACYPGRQHRLDEPHPPSLEALADDIAEALRALPPLPVVLFGHSMGAAVAYEVARRLERDSGEDPLLLAVSAHGAPHHAWRSRITDDTDLLAEVRRLGGTDADVLRDPEMRELVLHPLRCDYRLLEAYAPPRPVPVRGPIAAYVGREDPRVTVEDMRGWSSYTSSDFTPVALPGGHFHDPTTADTLVGDLTTRTAHLRRAGAPSR
ncbi:pyochelin biosynthetic protein PchC [Haloactinospora alba]|uniref:Pyochelin biosynthetic protein PchC n=1 Tax=Haloactinospora alba TaxID=405555 RepID=A0A543NEN3_9ACTN|nr:alpha/beta fold hydrolase [Haloactinospora alba]TQN30292.1 pyochelin biosynthetic protein PchC [Haloactinospora alba]